MTEQIQNLEQEIQVDRFLKTLLPEFGTGYIAFVEIPADESWEDLRRYFRPM